MEDSHIWTKEELEDLAWMRQEGFDLNEITEHLDMSPESVESKIAELNLPEGKAAYNRVETTVRKCMCCQKKFDSWGIGNRLCEYCSTKSGDYDYRTSHVKIG